MFDLRSGEIVVLCRACLTPALFQLSAWIPDPNIPGAFRADFDPGAATLKCPHMVSSISAVVLVTPAARAQMVGLLLSAATPYIPTRRIPLPPAATPPAAPAPPVAAPPASPWTPHVIPVGTFRLRTSVPDDTGIDDWDLLPDA